MQKSIKMNQKWGEGTFAASFALVAVALCLAAMLPTTVMANSSFDWTGTDGVVHIPDGTAALALSRSGARTQPRIMRTADATRATHGWRPAVV